ncbi:MAG: YIP1 family protein [Chloroflexaceae bacterium]|nr:YIP1 family protein [Chloroflexaceae bacterium]NJO04384.1 YIP1 family protein [Chloroflexaceae bacterium]
MVQQIPLMISQSIDVLTHPNEGTFEKYERSGTIAHAALYIGLAALIAGLFGLVEGPLGFVRGILGALLGFFIFTGLVYYIGKQQGGTGTFDEVAYTFSLFNAPLQVIGAVIGILVIIPILGQLIVLAVALALLVANVYFAYIAVRSSMNLRSQQQAMVTLGLAFVANVIIYILLSALSF